MSLIDSQKKANLILTEENIFQFTYKAKNPQSKKLEERYVEIKVDNNFLVARRTATNPENGKPENWKPISLLIHDVREVVGIWSQLLKFQSQRGQTENSVRIPELPPGLQQGALQATIQSKAQKDRPKLMTVSTLPTQMHQTSEPTPSSPDATIPEVKSSVKDRTAAFGQSVSSRDLPQVPQPRLAGKKISPSQQPKTQTTSLSALARVLPAPGKSKASTHPVLALKAFFESGQDEFRKEISERRQLFVSLIEKLDTKTNEDLRFIIELQYPHEQRSHYMDVKTFDASVDTLSAYFIENDQKLPSLCLFPSRASYELAYKIFFSNMDLFKNSPLVEISFVHYFLQDRYQDTFIDIYDAYGQTSSNHIKADTHKKLNFLINCKPELRNMILALSGNETKELLDTLDSLILAEKKKFLASSPDQFMVRDNRLFKASIPHLINHKTNNERTLWILVYKAYLLALVHTIDTKLLAT